MAEHWIKGAIKNHGVLRAKAQKANMTTRMYAEMHKHDTDKTGDEARLALTLMGFKGTKKSAAEKMYPAREAKK